MLFRNAPILVAGLIAASCTRTPSVEERREAQFEHEVLIQALSEEEQFKFPYVFNGGASVQLDEDENGDLLVCVIAAGLGDCLFTHDAPGEIVSVEQVLHCSVNTLALSYEVRRSKGPSVVIYFNDGRFTLDRDEADAWFRETPGCVLDLQMISG